MSVTAVNGLLAGDPQHFHDYAVEMSVNIANEGWKVWSIRPKGHGPAGLLSILYYFVGPYPLLVVLINSLCHALAAVFLVLIINRIVPIGCAVIASIYFIISPFQMHWLSQINKESYVIFGVFVFVYGVIRFWEHSKYNILIGIFWMLLGVAIISICRPYIVQILFVSTIILGFFVLVISIRYDYLRMMGISLLVFPVLFIPFMSGAASDQVVSAASYLNAEENILADNYLDKGKKWGNEKNSKTEEKMPSDKFSNADSDIVVLNEELISKYSTWTKSGILPKVVDEKLFALTYSRLPFAFLKNSPSEMVRALDLTDEAEFHSANDIILYMPRALQVALFAPFPKDWSIFSKSDSRSMFRTMVTVEMMYAYFAYIFLLMGLIRYGSLKYYIPVYYLLFIMQIYGIFTPNIGVMYRYKYSYLMLLVSLGMAFLFKYLYEKLNKIKCTVSK